MPEERTPAGSWCEILAGFHLSELTLLVQKYRGSYVGPQTDAGVERPDFEGRVRLS